MSQREFMIVLAHAHVCGACRAKLLSDPNAVFIGRSLTPAEKDVLTRLEFDDFVTPNTLVAAAGSTQDELEAYRDLPVVRLRHL